MDKRILYGVSLCCALLPSCRVLDQRVDLSWFRDTVTAPQNDTVYVESGRGLPDSAGSTSVSPQVSAGSPRQPDKALPASSAPLRTTTVTPPAASGGSIYTVTQGDTLSSLARRFNSTVPAISAANGMTNPNQLKAGDRIIIPNGTGYTAATTSAAVIPTTPTAAKGTTARPTADEAKPVKPRAARQKTSSSGWRFWPFRKKAPAAPQSRIYTVQPGDTLNAVARRYGIPTMTLMNANGISREQADRLSIGQRLIIPTASK